MTFTLKIELGNAAMLTGLDVSAALCRVADLLEGHEDMEDLDPYDRSGNIRDENGNTVGKWSVK